MPKKKRKTARTHTDVHSRAVFDSDKDFWAGPAGWVLVILMVIAGVAAIIYSYNLGGESKYGELSVNGRSDESLAGSPSRSVGSVILDGPRSPVDGTPLIDDGTLEYFAVMLDNHTAARPGAGVADAPLVIESPVEGGITRMMMIFPDGANEERIGPVRSARPYFVEWAQEYGAILIHVGGSPQALSMLAAFEEDRNLNQMVRSAYFWRDRDRDAPHNVYTSSDLLHSALEKMEVPDDDYSTDRPFKEGGFEGRPIGDPLVEKLEIDYSVASYYVTWLYDSESNKYMRYQGKGEYEDEDEVAVTADNVIVQYTEMAVIDNVGRKEIRTTGEGDAVVFRDGRAIEATWQKEDGGRTRFLFVGNDEEVPLNIGTTWIQVVDEEMSAEF